MFILKLILLIAAASVAALLLLRSIQTHRDTTGEFKIDGINFKLALLAVLLFLAGVGGLMAMGQIPTGSRGVVLRFGSVTGRTVDEGIYLITPFLETVQLMDVRTRAFEAEADAASKDLQNVHTKITLNYSLDPAQVGNTYRTLGTEYEQRIIVPAVQEGVKSSTALYDAERLIVERPAVKDAVERYLRTRLNAHGIILDTVSITGFNFSPEFNDAIERKVTATQNALTEQNNLEAIKFRAQQAVATAEGEAQSIRLKADALRLSPQVLQLNAIQKWNGVLPVYVGGNGPIPFIEVPR